MSHDPWALLREARDFMRQAAISRGPCPDCTECDHRDAVIAKADAALAEHDAVASSEEKVEWRNTPDGEDAVIDNVVLSVWGWRGGWAWQSKPLAEPSYLNRTEMGLSNTLDEAKAAALKAARGMR